MAESNVAIQRPQRWDNPFGPSMTDDDVRRILSLEPFSNMDRARFSATQSLEDIIRNDTRLIKYGDGDIVVRAGDYGHSAFLIIQGKVHVVLPPGLPEAMLGRATQKRRGIFESLNQLWKNARYPEVRDHERYTRSRTATGQRGSDLDAHIFLQDVPTVLDDHRTAILKHGEMFGEIAALGRTQRTATVFASGDAQLLEIRWQGFREIRRKVDDFRSHVDTLYRERSLTTALQATPMFEHLSGDVIDKIAHETLFETYGDFDWHTSYIRLSEGSAQDRLSHEPVIVSEGDYPDGLLLIRSGFGRISKSINNGHRTLEYIGAGSVFGMSEIISNWRHHDSQPLRTSLRALGYIDVLRVPTRIIEELVLPTLSEDALVHLGGFENRIDDEPKEDADLENNIDSGLLEFLVEHRYINGTATMLIDLDRCVRCDDCVTACAATHNNNPRFNRHGRTYDHYMIANACMHCADPVCMIGCPTGAIHRSSSFGQVIINDETCIGCATCANACPYDNIRMVEIRDQFGFFITDTSKGVPIAKATKCDLCIDQIGGPACQRACPHNALRRSDLSDIKTLSDWLDK